MGCESKCVILLIYGSMEVNTPTTTSAHYTAVYSLRAKSILLYTGSFASTETTLFHFDAIVHASVRLVSLVSYRPRHPLVLSRHWTGQRPKSEPIRRTHCVVGYARYTHHIRYIPSDTGCARGLPVGQATPETPPTHRNRVIHPIFS